MCGLIGYSGETPADESLLKILFLYNESRGAHTCGFYGKNKDTTEENEIVKLSGKASEKLVPLWSFGENHLFIGHTRHSTMGIATDKDNAHPFRFGKYLGAHNGVLKIENQNNIVREYDLDKSIVNIDSKMIFASMEKDDSFKVLGQLENSAAALLFTNTEEPEALYVYRNKERPLYRGTYKKDGNLGMYFSSIEAALEAIGCTNIQQLSENYLYKVENGKITNTKVIKDVPFKEIPKVEPKLEVVSDKRPTIVTSHSFDNLSNRHCKFIDFKDGGVFKAYSGVDGISITKEEKVIKGKVTYRRLYFDDFQYYEYPVSIEKQLSLGFEEDKKESWGLWNKELSHYGDLLMSLHKEISDVIDSQNKAVKYSRFETLDTVTLIGVNEKIERTIGLLTD